MSSYQILVRVTPPTRNEIKVVVDPNADQSVEEYTSLAAFPATGAVEKIYVDKATNLIYRWSGSAYVQLAEGSGGGAVESVNSQTGDVVLTTADISDSNDKRYVTESEKTVIGNTSGTNSGNETATTIGALIGGAGDATPNDTDNVATALTASGILKKITWTNVKAFLKTYFDSLYQSLNTDITLAENTAIIYNPVLSADGKYTGIVRTGTAGATLAFGDIVHLKPSNSRWILADSNSAAAADGDCRGNVGICVLASTDGNATKILLNGVIRADAKFPTMTINAAQFISETAGLITGTAPSTTDAVVKVVGFALTADELYFCPSSDWLTRV